MKKIFLACLFVLFSLGLTTQAQTTATQTTETKPKRAIFKANKTQVSAAQKIIKVTETGKLTKEDRAVLKTWQTDNGLKATGTLNRATLEKMNIDLTDKQKEIPVTAASIKSDDDGKSASGEKKKRGPVFRAVKDQVMQVQKMLKVTETGKMTKEDREALKKWQTENGLKATGGVNKETLEKMNIVLTDKQKEM